MRLTIEINGIFIMRWLYVRSAAEKDADYKYPSLKEAEKEYKKSKKTNTLSNFNTGKNVKEEVLPDWFNQSIKKEEISADDEKSLKDMLKEFS